MEFVYNPSLDLLLLAALAVKSGDSEGAAQHFKELFALESFEEDIAELEDLQQAAAELDGEDYTRHFPDDEDEEEVIEAEVSDDDEDEDEDGEDDADDEDEDEEEAAVDDEEDDDVSLETEQRQPVTAKAKLDPKRRAAMMTANLSDL